MSIATEAAAVAASRTAPAITAGPCYLYALTDAAVTVPDAIVGVGGHPVGTIRVGGLQVIASTTTARRIRPRRRELKSHQQTLATVFDLAGDAGCLPFAFGTIVSDLAELEALLSESATSIRAQLDRVAGCVELGLRLRWDVEDVARYFVATRPALAARADAAFAGGRSPSQEEGIALGQLFDQLRTQARDDAFAVLEGGLRGVLRDLRRNPARTEDEVCSLSLLVPRTALASWDGVLAHVAAAFDDDHIVDVSGPFPPFSFVDLDLDL